MRRALIALTVFCLPYPALAGPEWLVDHDKSSLAIALMANGGDMKGVFEDWDASIHFDPEDPSDADILIEIEIDSLDLGQSAANTTATDAPWLDSDEHPTAEFRAESMDWDDEGNFELPGTLKLRGVEAPITLKGTLIIDGDAAEVSGEGTIVRVDHGVGANDESVSDVSVLISIIAQRSEGVSGVEENSPAH